MISGGEFRRGELREDEIHGDAFAELKAIVLQWTQPEVSWPAGTTFTEPFGDRWSSTTCWADVPGGVRYELLLKSNEDDPRKTPPVLWSIYVNRNGEVVARPRIANMRITFDPRHPVDEAREQAAWAGVPIGLERSYSVGRLSRGLQQKTREVSEGWSFGGNGPR